jgi:HNH/ENDO VII superfamily nuclease
VTQLNQPIAVVTGSDDSEETHGCDWTQCKSNHKQAFTYPNDGVLDGANDTNLANTDQFPWLIGTLAGLPRDRPRFLGSPQWSFPQQEHYLLESKKKSITSRLAASTLNRADLPAEILAIVDNASISGETLVSLSPLAGTPKVADVAFELNTRSCLPYETQFADWGDKRIYRPPKYPCEAHHVLSKQFFGGEMGGGFEDLTANAKRIGYDVNCYTNGINLPRFAVDIVCHGLPQHEGNHDATDYNKKVSKVLRTIQNKSRKYCQRDQLGTMEPQSKLLTDLERKAAFVRRKVMEWKPGYELRPDNHERRKAAYNRIKLMLLFDGVDRGYPPVPASEYKNGKCKCVMCKKAG